MCWRGSYQRLAAPQVAQVVRGVRGVRVDVDLRGEASGLADRSSIRAARVVRYTVRRATLVRVVRAWIARQNFTTAP